VEGRLLVEAQRQIAVAARLAGEDQHVARAIHGLHGHLLLVVVDEEHVVAVVLPVARGLPQRLVEEQRRLQLDVAVRQQHVAHVVGDRVVDGGALGQPERRARRPRMELEEAEVLAQLAVVALLRFLDAVQVFFELLLREEGSPVDALHRLVLGVALPVGVRRRQQLEVIELADRGHVRADAEVEEDALDVVARRDRAALLLDQLHLQRLAARREVRLGVFLGAQLADEGQVAGRDLAHPLFDGGQILGNEGPLHDEVVVEAVVEGRADAALRPREQLEDRRRQEVRGAVAIEVQRFRIPLGDDADPGVGFERPRQIGQPIVDHHGQRRLRQARRDRHGQVGPGGAGRHLADGPVRQGERDLPRFHCRSHRRRDGTAQGRPVGNGPVRKG
jgi:hypothetical protein